jgi:hypothetical protein
MRRGGALLLALLLLAPSAVWAQTDISSHDQMKAQQAVGKLNEAFLRAGLKIASAAGGLWLIYAITPGPNPAAVVGALLLTAQGLLELHWGTAGVVLPPPPPPIPDDCSWFLGEDFLTYRARTGGGIAEWLNYWLEGTRCLQGG